ncbi:hypothetical protein FNV43_RR20122 [Rhamnella rubrinervis]|uniref:Uncharacterized protein n=1 Tax=Rhamnella rubrinervis TaxID=2594499 RepID=A0A8K0E025_9ROSA|nr:hypothetical protein FNV43_RR20122 [Rhamnella rubrinervis]
MVLWKEDDLFYCSYSVKWWDKFDITRIQKAMDLNFPPPVPITGFPKPELSSTSASSSKSKKELIEMAQRLLQQAEAQDDDSEESEASSSAHARAPSQPKEKSKRWADYEDDGQDPYDFSPLELGPD